MACGCLFYFLAALVYKTTAFSNNSYLITFPSTIRPGMTVDVNILILRTSPSDANVSVTAKFFIASRQVVSGVGLFRRGELGSIKLEIPMNESNQNGNERYVRKNIRVIGSGGLTFNETKSVNFDVKGLTIYIQTDKGIYKPGQTVHIRVIPVYPSLKIYHGRMTITVYDSKSNKLRLWKDVASSSGVVSKDFELSSQPNFGDWKIKAEVEGQSYEVSFEVKEYVLPKFEVKVLTNGYATKGNGDVRGTVTAKYTHGKNVKGKGTLSVHFTCHQRCKKFQLDFTVDGSYSFVIPKYRIESIYPTSFGEPYNYGIALTLNASVTEILTQKTYYGEALVRLYRSAALLDYPQSNPRAFKPGFPLQVLIKVQRPDGSPLVNTVVPVTSTISPGNTKYSRAYTSDKNGYVMMTQTLPVGATYIYINAKVSDECGEESSMYQSITRFTSDSKTYIAVTAEFNELNVGSEILLKIKSTEALSSFNYIVLSRGLVVKSGTVAVYPMATRATLKFRATTAMAPSAKIVVYFIRDDGEVVADSTALKINGAFENDVSVQFSRAQTKPGEAVSVKIKASPFSQVSVLAIDKSVLLLDKGNDLTVTEVMNDLASFGGDHSNYFPLWWRWRRRRSFFPWYPRATDSFQIFQSANLAIVTDCKINERLYIMYRTMESRPDVSLSSMRRIYHSNTKNTQPLAEVKKVRTLFPETWLWKTVTTDSFGNARLDSNSPDTITSWVLSGFAVSNLTGFGVANEKQQLRVFQPFFISMDLPYSVVRGEEVAIRVVVFNYNNEDAEVTVTLKGSNDWSNMIETTTNNIFMDLHRNDVKYVLKVLANNGAAVSFPIVPSKLGNIPITVRAQTAKFADGVTRTLLVEPEGVEQEYSYSLLIDLNSTESFNKELELALPSNLINGSAKAAISVIGDIMGSSINGIEKLLRMPYGCGEQNMINFAPSMFIRAYLETVDQLTSSIREKSVRYMTSGYQRELSYQHSDGSYSAFGERRGITRPGSLWLTAFVVKSFSRARSYIYIDPRSLNKSMTFILNNQERNGEFRETGSVGSYLQGGLKSSSPEALTAYVLVSLLESGDQSNRARRAVASTVRYLKSKLQEMTDVYTLALVAYAFELADDVAKEVVLNRLTVRAIREDGTLHWEEEKSESHQGSPWRRPYYRPRSADIEITSYILLVYAHRRDVRTGLPIAQWLAQQRNSLGGYSSTQDTVIGLQALSQFAPLVFSSEVNFVIDLRLSARASYEKRFHVDKSNLVVLQQEELPIVGGKVFIAANGTGIGVLQVGVTYNIDKPLADNSFEVFVTVKASDNNVVKAQPCVQYIGHGQESGMAILEFGLPSGFSLDQDEANRLLNDQSNKIKRVENPGRKAILYFDKIPKSEKLCVDVKSVRTHAVGKAQPVAVVIYDYYRPEKRSTTMYSTQNDVSVCDVCAECTHCNQRGGGHATRVVSFTHLVILVLTIFLYNI